MEEQWGSTGFLGPMPLPGERIRRACGDTQCRGQQGWPGVKEVTQ